MKLACSFLFFLLILTSCQEFTTSSLSDKYEAITDFQLLSALPFTLRESSGLEYSHGQIWTHNDGGDAANLYQIDSQSGNIISTLNITNTNNTDWEDITADSAFFYIADIGNNQGNRQDLNIIKISKPNTAADTSYAGNQINIFYADQNSFIFAKEMHDFNAEAIINVSDSLFIFSKNHISQKTRCYSISKNPNNYEISPSRQFDTEGLVTAADFDSENRVLILLGYNEYMLGYAPFIWCFWDFVGNDFFTGKNKRFNLNFSEQTEGITFIDTGIVLISTEKENTNGGNIWQIDLRQRVEGLW